MTKDRKWCRHSIATIDTVFNDINFNLKSELHKTLPDNTIGERIRKLRFKLGLDRIQFAASINSEITTVVLWEKNNIIPKPQSIKKISDLYNIPLKYFHEYYYIYYNDPVSKFLKWKDANNYTYYLLDQISDSNRATLYHFGTGKHTLSYKLYLKLKELGVFDT